MKQFCYYHIKTVENPKGNDCSAHMHEARCGECPYTEKDIQYGEGEAFGNRPRLYISSTPSPFIGACQDFKPIEGAAEGLIARLKAAKPSPPVTNPD